MKPGDIVECSGSREYITARTGVITPGLVVSVTRSGHHYDRGYSIEFLTPHGEVATGDMEDLKVIKHYEPSGT